MKYSILVAMTHKGIIGIENRLPWRLPDDLRRFKQLTMGKPVIMGRKTFQSIGKALPGRTNIVLTRDSEFRAEGVTTVTDWGQAKAAAFATGADECFIIGGAEIYKDALSWVDHLYLTEIHRDFPGDTEFPMKNWRDHFAVLETEDHDHEGLKYSYILANRTNS